MTVRGRDDRGYEPDSGANVHAPPPHPENDVAQLLHRDLHRHLAERFPGRFDRRAADEIVTTVLQPSGAQTVDTAHGYAPDRPRPWSELVAEVNRTALDRLAREPWNLSGTPDDDNEFVRGLFGGSVDAETVVAAMGTLVAQRQDEYVLIVTTYLDLTYLDGIEPDARAIAAKLTTGGHRIPIDNVKIALIEFFHVLREYVDAVRHD